MTTIFIALMLLLISYIFFTFGRIYEINNQNRENDEEIAERLAEEGGVTDAR